MSQSLLTKLQVNVEKGVLKKIPCPQDVGQRIRVNYCWYVYEKDFFDHEIPRSSCWTSDRFWCYLVTVIKEFLDKKNINTYPEGNSFDGTLLHVRVSEETIPINVYFDEEGLHVRCFPYDHSAWPAGTTLIFPN